MKLLLFALAPFASFVLLTSPRLLAAEPAAPSTAFDLREWKLQIPGPREVTQLRDYSSDHFFLNEGKEMGFRLDAAEKGPTKNTQYVRSELRHLPEWTVDGDHAISAEVRVISRLVPDKVTVLQIHGLEVDGKKAPPLLRVALKDGDLYAVLKTDSAGIKDDFVLLKRDVKASYEKITVAIRQGRLTIAVGGEEKLARDVSYWKFTNYFKAGCYPQAMQGTAEVFFRTLTVR